MHILEWEEANLDVPILILKYFVNSKYLFFKLLFSFNIICKLCPVCRSMSSLHFSVQSLLEYSLSLHYFLSLTSTILFCG